MKNNIDLKNVSKEETTFPLSRNFYVRLTSLKFYVYTQPFIYCLYFIYARYLRKN